MRRYIISVFIALAITCHGRAYRLDTISHISEYVQTVPELPEPSAGDWYHPNFYTFMQQMQPSLWGDITSLFGFTVKSWEALEFSDVLRRVTEKREQMDLPKKGNKLYQQVHVAPESKLYVWGDLHASLHSLCRGLYVLQQRGVINDQLQLQDEHTYIEIMGDTVNRAPYSLQTLTVILHLMEQNPQQVIYTRGNHETDSYWTNFTMREQLRLAADHLSDEDIPLYDEINAFFATLPHVLYVAVENHPEEMLHVSHGGTSLHDQIQDNKDLSQMQKIVARLRGEARFQVLRETNGLELIGFVYGAPEWSLISCPNWVYQHYFNFTYDAFATVYFGDTLASSTLTLNARDATHDDAEFQQVEHYHLTTGVRKKTPQPQALDAQQFSFGSSIAISSGLGMQGESLYRGITTAVIHENHENGTIMQPYLLNDAYMPHHAYQNATTLMDDFGVNTFVAPTGTPTLDMYQGVVKRQAGAIFFPVTGADMFRSSEMSHMIHFRPSYAQEARKLTEYMLEEHKATRILFFYQDDNFGRSLRDEGASVMQDRGFTGWESLSYVAGQVDFTTQAQKVREYNPSAIAFFSTVDAAKRLIRELSLSFLINRMLFGNSDLSVYGFRSFLRDYGLSCHVALAVPDPQTSDIPIAQEFREQMNKLGWPQDVFAFEGYIAIQLLSHALSQIKQPAQPSDIVAWFEQLDQYNFKGLELTFDPETRALSQPVRIEHVA